MRSCVITAVAICHPQSNNEDTTLFIQLQLNRNFGFLSYDASCVLRSFMVSAVATCSPVIIAKFVETEPGCRKGFISMFFSNFIHGATVVYHFVPQILLYCLLVHFSQLDLSILSECNVIFLKHHKKKQTILSL